MEAKNIGTQANNNIPVNVPQCVQTSLCITKKWLEFSHCSLVPQKQPLSLMDLGDGIMVSDVIPVQDSCCRKFTNASSTVWQGSAIATFSPTVSATITWSPQSARFHPLTLFHLLLCPCPPRYIHFHLCTPPSISKLTHSILFPDFVSFSNDSEYVFLTYGVCSYAQLVL